MTNIPFWGILQKDSRMRIFKTKLFHQWAQKIKLNNDKLTLAIDEINKGLSEARLGANLYKKRISLKNKGKRGGLRTIIALKKDDRAFYIYGYAKNTLANINDKERQTLTKLGKDYLNMNEKEIARMLKFNKLIEVL